jgi:glutathione S-transferase
MAPRVRMFFHPVSHYCVSADRMLALKGIPHELIYTPYHDHEALIRRTRQDYIPTLLWGEQVVLWSEIPEFLDRVRPETPLLPPGRGALARVLQNWAHQVVEERVWRAVVTEMPNVLRSDQERWVFEEMQTRARGPWHVLKLRKAEFVRELQTYFGLIDRLVEGRAWVLDEPTVADCALYGSLSPWTTSGHRFPVRFRHLNRWATALRRLGAP